MVAQPHCCESLRMDSCELQPVKQAAHVRTRAFQCNEKLQQIVKQFPREHAREEDGADAVSGVSDSRLAAG